MNFFDWNFCFRKYQPCCQGLIQKENVDIDVAKGAQISNVAKKIVTQRWLQIMILELKQTTHYNYYVIFSLSCSCYVADVIKKLELRLLIVIILFKIEFGHAQISVPKIGKPIPKIACINPWLLSTLNASGKLLDISESSRIILSIYSFFLTWS